MFKKIIEKVKTLLEIDYVKDIFFIVLVVLVIVLIIGFKRFFLF